MCILHTHLLKYEKIQGHKNHVGTSQVQFVRKGNCRMPGAHNKDDELRHSFHTDLETRPRRQAIAYTLQLMLWLGNMK